MSARDPASGATPGSDTQASSQGTTLEPGVLFDLTVPARADRLQVIRRTVDWAAEQAGFGQADREVLALAVDEGGQNVIRHAYGGDCDAPFRVRASLSEAALIFRLIDAAPPVDPDRIHPRPLDAAPPSEPAPGDLKPGGLGTRLMREVLDEIVYEDAPAGNVLRLVKLLRGPAT